MMEASGQPPTLAGENTCSSKRGPDQLAGAPVWSNKCSNRRGGSEGRAAARLGSTQVMLAFGHFGL